MAGLLAYAAEGGLAGAGKGLEQVGGALLKDQIDQGLARLQNDYAAQRQQAGFGHEEKMQGSQQKFEKGLKEEEISASSATAHFQQGEANKRAAQHEAGATARNERTAQSRENVATIRGLAAQNAKNTIKPWKVQSTKVYPRKPDGTPDYAAPPEDKPLLMNPNNAGLYAPVGDAYVRWNSQTNAPALTPEQLNKARTSVSRDELARLYNNPFEVGPPGTKGAGMTRLENFERLHQYVPAQIMSRLQQGSGGGAPGSSDQDGTDDQTADSDAAAQAADDNEAARE